jgi:DNA-binding GntR family transcriptional regulator
VRAVFALDVQPVDPAAPQSSALQAYRILERAVSHGTVPAGTKLPSERELARRLGVSRSTLRHVLAALADADLVEASPQRGWFVSRIQIDDPPGRLISFTESARQRGIKAGAEILSHAVRPADRSEQETLRVAPGSKVLALHRLRTLDETPVCIDTSTITLVRVPGLDAIDLTDTSLYDAMVEVAGVRPRRSDYAVHADAADQQVADRLEIPIGAPVLVGEETSYSATGCWWPPWSTGPTPTPSVPP